MPDYYTDAGLLSHLHAQNEHIDEYTTQAGASVADVTSIKEDYANTVAILNFCPLTEDYKTTAIGIKRKFLRGEIAEPLGDFAKAPDPTMPFALIAGVEKRSRERDGRFKRSVMIDEAARLALDLDDDKPQPAVPAPTVETFAAKTGYEFAVVVHNRGDADMYEVQIRRADANKWQTVKSGTGKSLSIVVEPTTPDQPEQLLVRVQLIKKNEHYGEPSEPSFVTVSP